MAADQRVVMLFVDFNALVVACHLDPQAVHCCTMAVPMLTPAKLASAAVEATPFDDLSVPEFRIRDQPVRPGERVVALDIPFDDPVPIPAPTKATPLRLVRPDPLADGDEARPACNEHAR